MKTPKDLKFTKTHEWAKLEEDNIITVGISDHAQGLLGDLVYVELPEVGESYAPGEECCVVESVKAASDVYCPISGTILEVNEDLNDTPELVNSEPYEAGWLFRIEASDVDELDELASPAEYESLIAEEA
ncbi:MAG: glycine cleavage system protein GcvH [Gammaproteobacteria bacterium]|nr:glycine cleavage system protein GcvH [Gammaproteobacteria bacterium]